MSRKLKGKKEEEKEWLIATDEGYKHEGEEISPSKRLQELLQRTEAKRHKQDDGSYILSYIEDDELYKEIKEEIRRSEQDESKKKAEEKEIEKVVKNPQLFGNSFSEVVRLLKSLDASLHDAIRAGKHPYFWMSQDSIKDAWKIEED